MKEFKTVGDLVKYLQQFDQMTPINMQKSIYDEDGWYNELIDFSSGNIRPNRDKDVVTIFV